MLRKILLVKTVVNRLFQIVKDIVQTLANLLGVEKSVSTTQPKSANNAEKNLPPTNTQSQKHVHNPALIGIVSIKHIGKQDTYNMEVKRYNNFSICDGFIVHNCIRYATEFEQGAIHRGKVAEEKEKQDYGTSYKRIGATDDYNGGWQSA